MGQKITPNLWFDHHAREAVDFYVHAFGDAELLDVTYYPTENLPDFQQEFAGEELVVRFRLADLEFAAINGGPAFSFTPATSFFVNFDPSRDAAARDHLDTLHSRLTDGGIELMPLGEYPFSPHYAWIQDRYGLSWQLILTDPEGDPRPTIVPSLLFTGDVANRAAEALDFYTTVFPDSEPGIHATYEEQTGPAEPGSLMFGDARIADLWVAAMDPGAEQPFGFNEAISFSVACADQAEIDRYWAALSTVPEAEQCGWCKDQFGVSWQIVPQDLAALMERPNAYDHLMAMRKLVIDEF